MDNDGLAFVVPTSRKVREKWGTQVCFDSGKKQRRQRFGTGGSHPSSNDGSKDGAPRLSGLTEEKKRNDFSAFEVPTSREVREKWGTQVCFGSGNGLVRQWIPAEGLSSHIQVHFEEFGWVEHGALPADGPVQVRAGDAAGGSA